jgi:hypothetical protein
MNLKLLSQIVIVTGFVLFIGSMVLGFVFMAEREAYLFDSDSGGRSDFQYSIILEPNHDYDIIVSFYDSANAEWESALVDGTVIVSVDGIEVDRVDLYDYSYDEDEYDSVSESYYFDITPTTAVNLTISGELVDGDEWWISIYRDVPAALDTIVFYTFVLFIIGIVVIIIGAGIFVKAKRSM